MILHTRVIARERGRRKEGKERKKKRRENKPIEATTF